MSLANGIVREVDDKGRARVEFPDRDGCPSWWLHVIAPLASAGGSRTYSMPEVGSQVACSLDERAESGHIHGAIYSDDDPPPVTDPSQIHMDLGGGLQLNYDKGAGKLTLAVPNGTTISAGGNEYVIGPEGVTLNANQFTVNAPTTFNQGFKTVGDGTTAEIGGSMKVAQNVDAGQKVTAGQEVSAPVLRGALAK